MNANQADRITRAREVLNAKPPAGERDTATLLFDLSERVGKLDYWLRDIIALAAELDSAPDDQPPTPARCGDHHASGVTNCVLPTGHDSFHHNGSGLTWNNGRSRTDPGSCLGADCDHVSHQWSTAPALDGYGYQLPEDYLRGGAQ